MYYLYSLLLVTWGILLAPVFVYRARRYGKYVRGLPERFGRLPASLRSDGGPTIWFHSCSVGETLSVQTLAHELHQRFPEARAALGKAAQSVLEDSKGATRIAVNRIPAIYQGALHKTR